ncbi:hypothetical protein NRS6118_09495 [Bacillus subtilis]|uniref:hypothetical protein n=1 Tax=Bacillus subtilis TaxID=1423 RepID=UPI0007C47E30|nr:hypothetical protein [Bacillus subtilis]MEC2218789.1 hypothetical protein [Bacillus subtilis]OAE04443.1 hypothetical protein A6A24_13270 [Bacillus subtilis]CAF1726028.1 hypothetical protein NRS6118_00141 [Bacillus subtilis]CAI6265142.1 hypothetical protein NRS6118_09495 [Bacillus subtilis]
METSTIISIVAIVISLFTLGVHLLKYLHTVPKLEVSVLDAFVFQVIKGEDRYGKPYRMIIELTLVNKSEQPISIYEYQFVSKEFDRPVFYRGHHRPGNKYTISKIGSEEASIDFEQFKDLKPPINLSPYSSEYGTIIFLTIPNLYTSEKEIDGVLTVRTSRKDYSIPVKGRRSDFIKGTELMQ